MSDKKNGYVLHAGPLSESSVKHGLSSVYSVENYHFKKYDLRVILICKIGFVEVKSVTITNKLFQYSPTPNQLDYYISSS